MNTKIFNLVKQNLQSAFILPKYKNIQILNGPVFEWLGL